MLGRFTTDVTLALDGDQTGLLAAQRTAHLDLTDRTVHLRVARLLAGKDPAELFVGDSSRQCLLAALVTWPDRLDRVRR